MGLGSHGAQSGETAEQPCNGKSEQRPPPVTSAAQASQQREGEHRNNVLWAHEEVNQAVVERPHAGGIEVGLGGEREHHECKDNQGVQGQTGLGRAFHATAFHMKNIPPTATMPPAKRSNRCPHPQRWTVPMPIPKACKHPVAMTKPML